MGILYKQGGNRDDGAEKQVVKQYVHRLQVPWTYMSRNYKQGVDRVYIQDNEVKILYTYQQYVI